MHLVRARTTVDALERLVDRRVSEVSAEVHGAARAWMRLAADQGNADGQYGLGAMYAAGEGVSRDADAARQWIERAASQGHAQAINALAQRVDISDRYVSGAAKALTATAPDGFVVEGAIRMLGKTLIPVNWLQVMENSLDPIHTEWLHGHTYEFVKELQGKPSKVAISTRHEKIAFREFEHGITKHRLLAGHSEDGDDWKIGHPVVFPNTLSVGR